MSSETSLLYGWTHIPSTNWSSGGRRPTYRGCGGGSPRREAEGRLMANVPPLGKTFFRKSTKKSGMSTFGSKTKVVRTEILHILVPKPSRVDLYLTISRVSIILSKLGVPGSIPHVFSFLGFSGAAQSFFRRKNRPFPKLNKDTLDVCHF